MLDAHCQAGFLVGVPFAHEGDYDFKLHGGKRVSQLLGITLWGVPTLPHAFAPVSGCQGRHHSRGLLWKM